MIAKLAQYKAQLIMAGAAIAVLAIAFGATYHIAYNKGLNVSKVEIQRYEGAVAILAKRLAEKQTTVTTRIQTEYLDRVVYRERIIYRNEGTIITQVPEQYTLSRGWVYAHDQSASNALIDPVLAADANPSHTTDKVALQLIADNYGNVCRANTDQLISLQSWVRQQEAANEEVNSDR